MKKTNPSTVFVTSENPSALTFIVTMTFPKPMIGEFSMVPVESTSRVVIVPDAVCPEKMKFPSTVIVQTTFVATPSPILSMAEEMANKPPFTFPIVRSGLRSVIVTNSGEDHSLSY